MLIKAGRRILHLTARGSVGSDGCHAAAVQAKSHGQHYEDSASCSQQFLYQMCHASVHPVTYEEYYSIHLRSGQRQSSVKLHGAACCRCGIKPACKSTET